MVVFSLFSLSAEEMKLNDQDVEAIQPIFDHLFKFEPLSYSLFSNKPVSFAQISKVPHVQIHEIGHLLSPDNTFYRLHSGWLYWKKFAGVRQFAHYKLIEKSADSILTIILVNKKELRRVFDQHKDLFHKVLGPAMTADLLIEEIASEKNSLREALKGDDRLLGILLGYGRRNSEAFFKRSKFWAAAGILLQGDLWPKNAFKPTYDRFSWLYLIQPVQFIGLRNDPETDMLIQSYSQASSRIASKFHSEHFVKVIIRELCKS